MVWRGDDRSYDQHFVTMINHQTHFDILTVLRAIISAPRQTVSDDQSSDREINSEERSSPRQTISDGRSSDRQNNVDRWAFPDWIRLLCYCWIWSPLPRFLRYLYPRHRIREYIDWAFASCSQWSQLSTDWMSRAWLLQSVKAHPWTLFWWGDDRSSELVWRVDDRSSETVWWWDDRSSDRHFVPLIDHQKRFDWEMIAHLPVKLLPMIDPRQKVPIICPPNHFKWSINGTKCLSEERSSPHQTVSDDRSSERQTSNSDERSYTRK